MKSSLSKIIGSFLFLYTVAYGEIIAINDNVTIDNLSQTPKNHDVKFIFETSLSTAQWDPGISAIKDTNQKLLDYDTEGLNLYSLKGKINIFDSDVLTIEKYGSFAGTSAQSQLVKNYEKGKSKNSAVEGLNISIKAFLLLKYFYLKDYKYLDALEYQYNSYKFYGLAQNSVKTLFWYGSTTTGNIRKDFFPLSKDSTIKFYTDFNEHRLYMLQLVDLFKSLSIDSIKAGIYSTNWLKPAFFGSYNKDNIPIIHHAEFISNGITLDFMHKFFDKIAIGFNLNYGFDNYINYTSNSLDVDYFSYDTYIDYKHNIYSSSQYDLYASLKAFMSKKHFKKNGYGLNSEDVSGISVGFSVIF